MPGIVTGKIAKINRVTRGWINYYALGSMKTAMTETDAHLRTRLRAVIWKPVESAEEAAMGIAETGDRKRLCKSNGLLWKLLSMGSNQNLCSQGNLKGSACESGTWKLSWLLQRVSCFEVMLNCHMPNGTYGGVRGWRKSALLDYVRLMSWQYRVGEIDSGRFCVYILDYILETNMKGQIWKTNLKGLYIIVYASEIWYTNSRICLLRSRRADAL